MVLINQRRQERRTLEENPSPDLLLQQLKNIFVEQETSCLADRHTAWLLGKNVDLFDDIFASLQDARIQHLRLHLQAAVFRYFLSRFSADRQLAVPSS